MDFFDSRMLNGMGVLISIVDTGGFASAAEALDMSPSGVSRAIARLESRLGIRLFDRTTRRVALTDDGRRFYEQILPLLAGLEEAAATASQGANAVKGRLRVNVDPLLSRLVLAPRLGDFLDGHPGLTLDLTTRDQLGDMIADGFDLALRFGHPRPSSLVARRLFDSRIVTVATPEYIRSHGRPLKPEDLKEATHVCIQFKDPETGKAFPWEFHKGRKRVVLATPGRLLLNDVATQLSVCLAGHGVAQMMTLGIESLLEEGRLVELFPDWRDEVFPLYAYFPSRHLAPAKTRAFLDFVVSLHA